MNITDRDWEAFISLCRFTQTSGGSTTPIMKQKDIIILRLYLTFMGLDDIIKVNDDLKFLELASKFIASKAALQGSYRVGMNPE